MCDLDHLLDTDLDHLNDSDWLLFAFTFLFPDHVSDRSMEIHTAHGIHGWSGDNSGASKQICITFGTVLGYLASSPAARPWVVPRSCLPPNVLDTSKIYQISVFCHPGYCNSNISQTSDTIAFRRQ